MVYIAMFSVTTALFAFADRIKQKAVAEWGAIFLLCLLAGLRGYGVGTDTTVYFHEVIDTAIHSGGFREYMAHEWVLFGWSHHMVSQYEPGFTLFVYFVSRVFRSVIVTQFAVQLLIIVPVYLALKRREEIPLWFGMLVYCLVFFNMSLNLVRQSIAVSFTLLASQLWMEKRKKAGIWVLVLACCFHKSALLTLIVIAIYEYFYADSKIEACIGGRELCPQTVRAVILMCIALVALLMITPMVAFLRNTPLARLSWYLDGDLKFMPNQVIKLLPPLLIMMMNRKRMSPDGKEAAFYMTIIILAVFLLQLTSITTQSGRIADYFLIYGVISYPMAGRKGSLSFFAMLGYLVFYWLFYYGYRNIGETLPYCVIGL